MDFAFEFYPLDAMNNNQNEMKVNMNREDMMNNSDFANNNLQNNPNNQSPLVKLSLDNDDFKGKEMLSQQVHNDVTGMNNQIGTQNNFGGKNEIDNLQNLMYVGVPSKSYRQVVYSLLLDLPNFFEKTRIILYNKYQEEANSPRNLFAFFANQLYEQDPKINIIFSLIDNDINYISTIENSSLEELNNIKKIAKAFFIWAELRIGLNDNNDKYVYFIGLLSLTQKLLKYFEDSYFVFWILVGLSQNIAHFHQKNPLFADEMNYINIYGLVTKLIMERHQKKIYDK